MLRKHSRGMRRGGGRSERAAWTGRKKRRFVPPIRISHGIAGVLGLALLVFAGWAVFADDPFGGEPMIVVSADPRAPPQVGKQGDSAHPGSSGNAQATAANPAGSAQPSSANPAPQPGAGDPAAATAAGAEKAPAAGTDGHHHRRHERQAAGSRDRRRRRQGRARPAWTSASARRRATAAIPKIAPDGARAADVYARPVQDRRRQGRRGPRVAIVMGGLGIGAAATFEAIGKLPGPVTLAFAPYGGRRRALGRARPRRRPRGAAAGPDGAVRLSRQRSRAADPAHLAQRRPEHRPPALVHEPVPGLCRHCELHGRPVFGDRGRARRRCCAKPPSAASSISTTAPRRAASPSQIAGANNLPFAKADIVLDAVPTPAESTGALSRLEALARERGVAVGIASRAAGLDRAHRPMGEGRREPRHPAGADQRGRGQAEADVERDERTEQEELCYSGPRPASVVCGLAHDPLRRPSLSPLRRHDGVQPRRACLHRPPHRRPRARRQDACLADAAGRRRPGRGSLAVRPARALRGNQHPLGRAPRRDRRVALLRHSARDRRPGLEAASTAARRRNGLRCASPATRARSTSHIRAAA